jgi:hypothetical protein
MILIIFHTLEKKITCLKIFSITTLSSYIRVSPANGIKVMMPYNQF